MSSGTSRAELMGPSPAPAPGPALPQGSVKKWCWGEPPLPWTVGLHHPGLQSCPCWKTCPALTLLWSDSPPCGVKARSPGRGSGAAAPSGAGLAGSGAGSTASTEAASTAFYSKHGQVDSNLYLLRTCFLNIINSDYCPQISLQNLRVIGFYNAVKKDINWFRDWLDNHLHHSFINIAIIWHF